MTTEEIKPKVRLKDVTCPQCAKPFELNWMDNKPTLIIRDCPSGGVYDVVIKCPYCNYEEDL